MKLKKVKWNNVIKTITIPLLIMINFKILKTMFFVILGSSPKTDLNGGLFLLAELFLYFCYMELKYRD